MKNLLCKSVGIAAMLAVCGAASAQITYSSAPGLGIVDNATVSDTITVAGGTSAITGLTVQINLTHTWDSDLDIALVSPSGAYILLTSDNQGSGDNYTNTVFSDAGAASITTGVAPCTGTFQPEGLLNGWNGIPNPPGAGTNHANLAGFNASDANGAWTLFIADDAGGDNGTLIDWSITVSGSIGGPTPPFGVPAASPTSVTNCGADTSLLTVTVTPGTLPASTGITVTGDLTNIGGAAGQTFFDNATNGDVTAGDNVFSYLATIPNTVTQGNKSIAYVVADAELRSTTPSGSLTVTSCPPLNDNCSGAFPLVSGANPFTGMTAATTDGTASCDGSVSSNDIWFTWTSATGGPVIFDTCSNPSGGTFFDSVLSVFSGGCGGAEVACSDDFGGTCATNGWGSKVTVNFAPGETMHIRLAAYNAAAVADGTGVLTVTDVLPLVVAGNASTAQETTAALLTATVTPGTVPLSTGITVTGDLSSIGGSATQAFYDDGTNGDVTGGDNVFSYSYTLPVSVVTGAYTIPVNAADAQLRTATGTINFNATNGPNGACCNAGCSITRQTLCVSGGGTWQGNGTNCGGPSYTNQVAGVGNDFFSIAGTGTLLATVSNCDDCTEDLAMPFPFNFYGAPVTNVAVSSNGNVQFVAPGTGNADFSNSPIPDVFAPFNAIFPAWDDYNTGDQGDVYYQVFGTSPNQVLKISWEGVTEFGLAPTFNNNNFQITFFEGTDDFIVQYGTMDNMPEAFTGDITIGTQNATGTSATQQATASTGDDTETEWNFATLPDPCGPSCDGIDFNNDGLFPDTNDIDQFLIVFSGGVCDNDPFCNDIDFNNDTLFPDTLDIDALLSVFSGGPCLL